MRSLSASLQCAKILVPRGIQLRPLNRINHAVLIVFSKDHLQYSNRRCWNELHVRCRDNPLAVVGEGRAARVRVVEHLCATVSTVTIPHTVVRATTRTYSARGHSVEFPSPNFSGLGQTPWPLCMTVFSPSLRRHKSQCGTAATDSVEGDDGGSGGYPGFALALRLLKHTTTASPR